MTHPNQLAAAAPGAAMDAQTQHLIEQYLYHEARLLDARDWVAWEHLFTADGMYWAPLTHDQVDPLNHASIFYENAIMRDVRRRRLGEIHAWSQQPVTRSSRIVGNVMLEPVAPDALTVYSTFHMVEWRKRNEQRHVAGHYTHHLVRQDDAWRIQLKRVDLVNCDGVHDCFEIFV